MNLLDDARNLLEASGYLTRVVRPDEQVLYFEDETLLGFVRVTATVAELEQRWRAEQETFLRMHSLLLLRAPLKAWNLYAVFLTDAPASDVVARSLFAIEEDFQSARKIARAGIRTRDELAIVLGPILPIQTTLSLTPIDVHARLLERLGPQGEAGRLLLSSARPEDIAKLLAEEL